MRFALVLFIALPVHAGDQLEVVVDPAIELMSILFRMAGNPEYRKVEEEMRQRLEKRIKEARKK